MLLQVMPAAARLGLHEHPTWLGAVPGTAVQKNYLGQQDQD